MLFGVSLDASTFAMMPRSWIKTANNYFSCLAKNDLRLDHFTAIHVFGLSFSFGLNSMKKQTLSYWIWGCTIADWIVFILAFPITVDKYYAVFFVQTKDSSSSTNQSSIPQSSVLLTCKSWRYSVQKGSWTFLLMLGVEFMKESCCVENICGPPPLSNRFQSVVGWKWIQNQLICPSRIRMSSKLFTIVFWTENELLKKERAFVWLLSLERESERICLEWDGASGF